MKLKIIKMYLLRQIIMISTSGKHKRKLSHLTILDVIVTVYLNVCGT